MSSVAVPNLIQFLESVPPPVTLLLVELAPFISWLRWTVEVVSWKTDWTDPWLVLAGWWALCLSTNAVLSYLLPLVLLVPSLLSYLPSERGTHERTPPPTTEYSIKLCLSDISTIHSLLPTLPILPTFPLLAALRLTGMLYIPYLILTYFVSLSVLIGIVGTLLLTYRAAWALRLRSAFWRSAYIRYSVFMLWSMLTGMTPPAFTASYGSQNPSSSLAPPSKPARFLFTILECQRWWVGLDWTAALLPGERPSWCSMSHQPVSPPGAFSLPLPTFMYFSAPNGQRVKRMATWRWEEPEWGMWINKDGTTKRVEKKPPGLEEEDGGIANKAASMFKERKPSMGSRPEISPGKDDQDAKPSTNAGPSAEHESSEDLATDQDGWIYGDNKWEGVGPKGGLGKYTRYRRWSRIAVLTEVVEVIAREDVHTSETVEMNPKVKDLPREPEEQKPSEEGLRTTLHSQGEVEERGDGRPNLRLRLKTAVQGGPYMSPVDPFGPSIDRPV